MLSPSAAAFLAAHARPLPAAMDCDSLFRLIEALPVAEARAPAMASNESYATLWNGDSPVATLSRPRMIGGDSIWHLNASDGRLVAAFTACPSLKRALEACYSYAMNPPPALGSPADLARAFRDNWEAAGAAQFATFRASALTRAARYARRIGAAAAKEEAAKEEAAAARRTARGLARRRLAIEAARHARQGRDESGRHAGESLFFYAYRAAHGAAARLARGMARLNAAAAKEEAAAWAAAAADLALQEAAREEAAAAIFGPDMGVELIREEAAADLAPGFLAAAKAHARPAHARPATQEEVAGIAAMVRAQEAPAFSFPLAPVTPSLNPPLLPMSRGAARVALALARGRDFAALVSGDFGPRACRAIRMGAF